MLEQGKLSEGGLKDLIALVPSMSDYQLMHLEKFVDYLNRFPQSGSGQCHISLLGIGNHAVRADINEKSFLNIMRGNITGKRHVPDTEISDAYRRARADYVLGREARSSSAGRKKSYSCSSLDEGKIHALQEERDRLIRYGAGVCAEDIMEASPIMPSRSPSRQLLQVLSLYDPDEILYAGGATEKVRPGKNLISVRRLRDLTRLGNKVLRPNFVPNPFTGRAAPKKSGDGLSYRCDHAVASFRLAVAEFDGISIADQLAYWSQVDLPIVALIFSGKKSIHAWIRVEDVVSVDQWQTEVKEKLYQHCLVPMGVDSACSNPSRLSRTPGFLRSDTQEIQQLLYLCPEGRGLAL